MSPDPEDTVAFYVRLPRGLHDAVRARAKAEDRNMAQVVRQALRQYLADNPVE